MYLAKSLQFCSSHILPLTLFCPWIGAPLVADFTITLDFVLLQTSTLMIDCMLWNWTLSALDLWVCAIYQFSQISITALSLHIFHSLPSEAKFSKILEWLSQKKDTFGPVVRIMTKLSCIHTDTLFSPVFSVVSFWLRNPSPLPLMNHFFSSSSRGGSFHHHHLLLPRGLLYGFNNPMVAGF